MAAEKKFTTKYGVVIPDTKVLRQIQSNVLQCELWHFRLFHDFNGKEAAKDYNGGGIFQHAVRAANMLWRQPGKELFKWHPDLETALREYCDVTAFGETLVTGPASAGKTFGAAIYAYLSWLSDPENTGVLVCSSTLGGLKLRLWGDIRKLHLANAEHPMFSTTNLVDSLTCIQSSKGETKRGIFGIAVAEGNETKAIGRIIGFHPPRLIVIVDELTDVGWAIVEACTNLFTGKKKAHFIGIGNASSIFDSHGKMCEPKEGWNTVTVESERWETLRGGVCLHFDGFKSPNVVEGRVMYDFLMTAGDIKRTAETYGENSPQMWRMRRGFWCPEGTVSTVLSEPIIKNFMCMEKATWDSEKKMYAGLDPAFEGGDRCVLRFGMNGKDTKGKDILELGDIITIKPDSTRFNQRPLEYQIADKVKSECVNRGVEIQNFGMDTTGAGAGLAAIISEEWGYGFNRVHFAESASEAPVAPTDFRTCKELYKNKVTELWYSIRQIVMGYQLKGLDAETALELCARRYTSESKIVVESKSDMKSRPGAKSPDLADALAVLCDTVKHKGGLGGVSKARKSMDREWENMVREFHKADEESYADDPIAV